MDPQFVVRDFTRDPEVRAVIVSFTRAFDFDLLTEAFMHLTSDKSVLFLATEPDAQIPGKLPDGSSIVIPGQSCSQMNG